MNTNKTRPGHRAPRASKLRRLLVVTALIVLPNAAQCASLVEQAIAAPCDTSQQLFVALGKTVLALPGKNRPLVDNIVKISHPASIHPLPPPDATQTSGCYGNPVQTVAVNWLKSLVDPLLVQAGVNPGKDNPDNYFSLTAGDSFLDSIRYVYDQLAVPSISDCQTNKEMTICIGKRGPQPTKLGPGNFIHWTMSQLFFPTYGHQDLIVLCPADPKAVFLPSCWTVLGIKPDVFVDIEFIPPVDGYANWQTRMATLMRNIKTMISDRTVKNYPWPISGKDR